MCINDLLLVKLEDSSSLHNNTHGVPDKEKSQSIIDVDPEQLYSKVVSKKERQEKSVSQSQSDYSVLQHKKAHNVDNVSNSLPACTPQLYSILDSPHRAMSAGDVTKHTSVDYNTPPGALYSSSGSSCVSSDDQCRLHVRHKPFQPIVYLPPKCSTDRRHDRSGNKRTRSHQHNDSGMVARSHSASSDHMKKNEFLVQGTTLDGSVTLYAASPVGSPLPPEQAGPILNMLSSRPLSRQDHMTGPQSVTTSQPLSHAPHHQSFEQHRSLEQPVVMQQQQWNVPMTLASAKCSIDQPVSTSASLTTSVDLQDHQQYQGQNLSSSLPVTVSLDRSDQHQAQKANTSHANLDQHAHQIFNNDQSLIDSKTGCDTCHDQRTGSSLYQDMLELMQKRETELTLQVNSITADKERLQAERTLLQKENNSSRKLSLMHELISYPVRGENSSTAESSELTASRESNAPTNQ